MEPSMVGMEQEKMAQSSLKWAVSGCWREATTFNKDKQRLEYFHKEIRTAYWG